MHRRKKSTPGYSLFELIMTLALASLLILLGIPSFAALIADKQLRAETDALFHAAYLARKISIAQRRVAAICPSTDGRSCDPLRRWSAGWLLYENLGSSRQDTREQEEKIHKYHLVKNNVLIQANRNHFAFRATHRRATNGTFVFCDPARRIAPRALIVSYTGRPRVAQATTDGRAYTCSL